MGCLCPHCSGQLWLFQTRLVVKLRNKGPDSSTHSFPSIFLPGFAGNFSSFPAHIPAICLKLKTGGRDPKPIPLKSLLCEAQCKALNNQEFVCFCISSPPSLPSVDVAITRDLTPTCLRTCWNSHSLVVLLTNTMWPEITCCTVDHRQQSRQEVLGHLAVPGLTCDCTFVKGYFSH